MGIDSEYYKEKNKKKLIKLRQLESVMPPYVVSYLNDKELSSQINTVIAYAYDLQTFFRFLTEKNNLLKNTAIKNISIDFLECLTFEDINEYQRYLSGWRCLWWQRHASLVYRKLQNPRQTDY